MAYTYPLAVASAFPLLMGVFGAISHYRFGRSGKSARNYAILACLAFPIFCFAIVDLYEHPEKMWRHGPSPHPECELGVC